MARKNLFGLFVGGSVLSLLLGSGLFAALSDTVESVDNNARSNSLRPARQDLQAATVDRMFVTDPFTAACDSAPYADGPLPALVNPSGDINVGLTSRTAASTGEVLCLRNVGTMTGRVRVVFHDVVQTEVGPCTTEEVDAGDTTCNDLDPGELNEVVKPRFVVWVVDNSGDCAGVDGTFADWEGAGHVLAASLAPGQTCAWEIELWTDIDTTEARRLRAQTDLLQWDISFVLEDIPA